MCSSKCPCDNTVADQAFMDSLGNLADFGSVGREPSTGVDANLIALEFGAPGDANVVKNYNECYQQYVSLPENAPADGQDDDWQEFVTNGGFDFLEAMEAEFDCAGICYSPLFYMTKDVSNVPVSMGCVEAFLERAKSTAGVGVVGVITGLILWLAACGAIPLCSDFARDKAAF